MRRAVRPTIATSGEKSMPPTTGSTCLSGRSTGSQSEASSAVAGPRAPGAMKERAA